MSRVAQKQLVSRAELPHLLAQSSRLTAEDLADEADDPGMLTHLANTGFLGGFVRDLRGRARDITGADSRVLLFASPQGAAAFSAFVADAPDPFFGGPSRVKRMKVDGRTGYLIEPPICDCPGAYPVYVGIVPDGPRLLWLQLTGPRVSVDDVHRLLDDALSRGS